MSIVAIGLNHRTAPLELLERMAVDGGRLTLLVESHHHRADVAKWIELCQAGDFYSYLWEQTRQQSETAFANIIKSNGQQIQVDLRECSLRSFKRSCLVPLYSKNGISIYFLACCSKYLSVSGQIITLTPFL